MWNLVSLKPCSSSRVCPPPFTVLHFCLFLLLWPFTMLFGCLFMFFFVVQPTGKFVRRLLEDEVELLCDRIKKFDQEGIVTMLQDPNVHLFVNAMNKQCAFLPLPLSSLGFFCVLLPILWHFWSFSGFWVDLRSKCWYFSSLLLILFSLLHPTSWSHFWDFLDFLDFLGFFGLSELKVIC